LVLPGWVAWIVHVPALNKVTIAPDIAPATVQTGSVVDAKLTGRLEDAVAVSFIGAIPNAWFDTAPKVMIWLSCVTLKLWLTGVAAP
jgi:hypothetical protein